MVSNLSKFTQALDLISIALNHNYLVLNYIKLEGVGGGVQDPLLSHTPAPAASRVESLKLNS